MIRRSLSFAVLVCLAPSVAHAETAIDVKVRLSGKRLSAEPVRAAILREIATETGKGELVVTGDDKRARLRYRDARGRVVDRAIVLPPEAERAAEAIALLAGNLVRDQSAAIVDLFRPKAADPKPTEGKPATTNGPAVVEVPPSPVEAAPPSTGTPITPPAETAANTSSPAPADATPPPAAPPPAASHDGAGESTGQGAAAPSAVNRPPSPCTSKGRTVAFGADLVPRVGTSAFDGGFDTARNVSVHLLAGAIAGTRGLEISGAVGIDRYGVCGAQVSGLLALSLSKVEGTQIAGAAVSRSFDGAQIAGFALARGDLRGLQIVGAGAITGRLDGAQIGAVGVTFGEVHGIQLGGINVATGDVRGVQLGVINVAENSDVSFGLINVIYRGDTHLDAVVNESGLTLGLLGNGGRYLYTMYGGGIRPSRTGARGALAFGFGNTIRLSRAFSLDTSLLLVTEPGSPFFSRQHHLLQARVFLAWSPSPHLAILAGPTANALSTEVPEQLDESPAGAKRTTFGSQEGRLWAGVAVGARLFLFFGSGCSLPGVGHQRIQPQHERGKREQPERHDLEHHGGGPDDAREPEEGHGDGRDQRNPGPAKASIARHVRT
jgi:hypothetical protein